MAHVFHLPDHPRVEFIRARWVDQTFPRHAHRRLVIGVNVSGVHSYTYRGRRVTEPPGHVAFINPGEAHTGQLESGTVWDYRGIYVTPNYLRSLAGGRRTGSRSVPVFREALVDNPGLARDVIRVHALCERQEDPLQCEYLFQRMLRRMLERYASIPRMPERPSDNLPAVRRARDFLEANLAQRVSLAELARVAKLNKYHLLRLFEKEVGLPPHAYLLSRRIQESQSLLRQGMACADVAAELGFADQAHFSRRFKRTIGVSPAAWVRSTTS